MKDDENPGDPYDMYGDGNPNGGFSGVFDNSGIDGIILGEVNLPSGGLDGIRGGKNRGGGNRAGGNRGGGWGMGVVIGSVGTVDFNTGIVTVVFADTVASNAVIATVASVDMGVVRGRVDAIDTFVSMAKGAIGVSVDAIDTLVGTGVVRGRVDAIDTFVSVDMGVGKGRVDAIDIFVPFNNNDASDDCELL